MKTDERITWKRIPTMPQFSASSDGQIYGRGRLYKYKMDRYGYPMFRPMINGKRRVFRVHVLIAKTFLGERPVGMEVNHKDLNKNNPKLDNLEYVTHTNNLRHAIRNGVRFGLKPVGFGAKGESNPMSKLTWKQVRRIRYLYGTGAWTQERLGNMFSVSQTVISKVLRGVTWNAKCL